MAFLSEGAKSSCLRGVLKILVFDLGGKKMIFFVQGGLKKRCSRGVKFSEKCLRGGKIVKINCPRG